jgi:glycosyltransferase involved in cell wall biosynthesis
MLISVYSGEKPKYFDECLNSVFSQSYPPSEVVLVCDGTLTPELYAVVDKYKALHGDTFKPIQLEKNVGTGKCANIGIGACKNEIIIKTDSDDISRPDRCSIQVSMFESDPDLVMCGGYIQEFQSETGEPIAVKSVPLTHEDILKYAKRRNPINNPTIAIKKSFAQSIGGFNETARCEDYDFVCRMLMAGAKSCNTSEILLNYRVTKDNYIRRKNWKNTKSFIKVRWANFKRGFCSFLDFLVPCAMQLVMFILPSSVTGMLYKKFLR